MQLADRAFRQRHELDAVEGDRLEQGGDVFLVARETVERLGEDDIELPSARCRQQILVSRPEACRAAGGAIGIFAKNLHACASA